MAINHLVTVACSRILLHRANKMCRNLLARCAQQLSQKHLTMVNTRKDMPRNDTKATIPFPYLLISFIAEWNN